MRHDVVRVTLAEPSTLQQVHDLGLGRRLSIYRVLVLLESNRSTKDDFLLAGREPRVTESGKKSQGRRRGGKDELDKAGREGRKEARELKGRRGREESSMNLLSKTIWNERGTERKRGMLAFYEEKLE